MSVAADAAEKAGRYALDRSGNIEQIDYKGALNNLVTDVDRRSEAMIVEAIKDQFPDHGILAEESATGKYGGRIEEEYLWIIDPLDGTTNYAHGFPFYCVSIGVAIKGEIRVAAVYIPSRDELFSAVKGEGARLNGKPVSVSEAEDLSHSLISTGFAYDRQRKSDNLRYFEKIMARAQGVRRAGAAVIDLCYVACGRFDGFWEFELHPWDIAAGQLIVTESNGKVGMLNEKKLDIFGDNIIATNGKIHKELTDVLDSVRGG
ncbi:MAG: inositol monophosphatase [Candidatus Omnitrophica bacterium]|nr:inositol monophosphatase [Candidatus Omnitrophota bacterium]